MPRPTKRRKITRNEPVSTEVHNTPELSGELILPERTEATKPIQEPEPAPEPRLPLELLITLPEYIPVEHWPIIQPPNFLTTMPASYLSRQRLLRALSQTCRKLRHIFLPQLWHRLDVPRISVSDMYIKVKNILQRRMNGLLRNRILATHVRLVCMASRCHMPAN